MLGSLLSSFALFAATSAQQDCKCLPSHPCWPAEAEWKTLNETVGGRLIKPTPPGAVCYQSHPAYNAEACTAVISRWFDSSFHAEDPSSIDWPFWTNNTCVPVFPNGTSVTGYPGAGNIPCDGKMYPAYVVNATEASHISATVKFAADRNVRLNVKATGHSLLGRSVAGGSLSVWTHYMRGVEFHHDYTAPSCAKSPKCSHAMAATVAAGEYDLSIYRALAPHGAVIVAGSHPTVGIMGWMTGGGGHGPLTGRYGLGLDNLLSATVVLPKNGEVVTANAGSHPDLYYALRGGSSTFGIIVDATFRAYKSPQTITHGLAASLLPENATSPPTSGNVTDTLAPSQERLARWWRVLAEFHAELQGLKTAGIHGYYQIYPPPLAPTYTLVWGLFGYDTSAEAVEAALAPVISIFAAHSDLITFTNSTASFPDWNTAYQPQPGAEPVATGQGILTSRFLPATSLTDPAVTASYLSRLSATPLSGVTGPVIFGGYLICPARDGTAMHPDAPRPSPEETAVTEAWRDATSMFLTVPSFPERLSRADLDTVTAAITEQQGGVLAEWATVGGRPGKGGSYFNEGDTNDPDRRDVFWGEEKYVKLLETKRKYDPKGVMWCRGCVASEEWVDDTEEGSLCRAGETYKDL